MWAPLISLSVRLFANVLSGTIIIGLVYSATSWAAPIVAPALHGYFDLFSGAIQTLVFMLLTLLMIQQEIPEQELIEMQKATA
jgi:F-type H+-transporting ATPase subunit a